MRNFHLRKSVTKTLLNDVQKKFLIENVSKMPIEELADEFGITRKQAINQCTRMYLSYFSKAA